MNNKSTFRITVSAAFILLATSLPVNAGSLSQTVGGVLGGVGNAVGNTVGAVGNTVNGVADTTTTASIGTLNRRGVLSADAKSDIIDGVMAKARVLSPKELARLCLTTGGGDKGCGSGNRPRILGLIDARLELLSSKRLISVCATVGAGCGGSQIARIGSKPALEIGAINIPGATLPDRNVPGSSLSNRARQNVGNLSNREVLAYKKRCVNVLSSPQKYESDIVSICRLIKG